MFGIFKFFDAAVSVAYHVVTDFTHVLTPVAGAGVAAAAAIAVFTIVVRLLLSPLSYVALRGQAAQARLQPEVQEIRRRYARQPDRQQRELSALYQREGGGLLSGCLPLLAQIPFFSVMYRLFRSASVSGHPNLLLTHLLLGAPLGAHWLAGAGPFSAAGLVFLGLFALLGVVGWLSARLARQSAALTQPTLPAPLTSPALLASAQPPQRGAKPAQRAAQPAGQEKIIALLTKLMPYTTVVIAMFVPLAAGLYLLTTTSWTVAERAALRRRAHQSVIRKAVRAGTAATCSDRMKADPAAASPSRPAAPGGPLSDNGEIGPADAATNHAGHCRNSPAAGNAASLRRKRPGRRVEGNAARPGN